MKQWLLQTKRKTVKVLKWLWRIWPLHVILALLCVHLLLIYYFGLDTKTTNKTIALLSQVVGGILILYSIDSNIGIFKDRNLVGEFIQYLREFPLIKRSVTAKLNGQFMGLSGIGADLTYGRKCETVEEKLEYLQEQIAELRQHCKHKRKEIDKRFKDVSKEMKTQDQKQQKAVEDLKSKIEKVSVGGIKVQMFGVMLMVYGAISGYVA